MKITRTSIMSGVGRTRDIAVTPEQMAAWKGGMLIQDAMPHLSASDREFILTGITAEEWKELDNEGGIEDENEEDGDTWQP